MTQRIVDALEPVQVDEHHGHLIAIACRLSQRLVQAVAQQGAIGQAGQGIVVGHLPDPPLGPLALEDLVLKLGICCRQIRSTLLDTLLKPGLDLPQGQFSLMPGGDVLHQPD
jgi:hypothetical protein